jgi:plastocyanin
MPASHRIRPVPTVCPVPTGIRTRPDRSLGKAAAGRRDSIMKKQVLLTVVAVVLALCGVSSAQQWGSLTGRIAFDGAAPTPEPIVLTKEVELCGKFKLVSELISVGKDGGLQNVAVLLYADAGATVPVHDSYAEAFKTPVVLDNKNCRFEPHVLAVRVGQPLLLKNSDPVGHNSKLESFANPGINPIIPPGTSVEHKFATAERFPVNVGCAIHPWMNAQIYVSDHPYMAISGADGRFEIKNLPAGKWTFMFRHETGYVQEVKWNGKAASWTKGRVEIEIKPGVNDIGEITFAPKK